MDTKEQIELWFVRYSDDIYKFLVYYTRNLDVEDLVQEVFIKAMKGIQHFENRSHPKTWLLSIARHTAIDYSRKRRILQWIPESFLRNVRANEKSPEEVLQLNEEMKELYQALGQLKQSYREVLILRGIKGLSVTETAQILSWSESKVNITLHRAIKALQKKLGNEMEASINDAI